MISNAMPVNQRQEIPRRESRQRRFAEMRIRGKEVLRPAMKIGEIAAAAAGNEDLLSDPIGVLEHNHAPASPPGFDGAHQSGGAGACYDDIELLNQGESSNHTPSFKPQNTGKMN